MWQLQLAAEPSREAGMAGSGLSDRLGCLIGPTKTHPPCRTCAVMRCPPSCRARCAAWPAIARRRSICRGREQGPRQQVYIAFDCMSP